MRRVKKIVALILALALCLSLMPTVGVAAETVTPTDPTVAFETEQELIDYVGTLGSDANKSFLTMKYVAPGEDATDPFNATVGRIDFGVYNMETANAFQWGIWYNPEVFALRMVSNGNLSTSDVPVDKLSNVKMKLIIPRQFPDFALTGENNPYQGKYFFKNLNAGTEYQNDEDNFQGYVFSEMSSKDNTYQVGATSTEFTGTFTFTLSIPNEGINDSDLEGVLGTDASSGNKYFCTTQYPEHAVYVASIYVSVKGTPTAEDFRAVTLTSDVPQGGSAMMGTKNVTKQTALIGFKQPRSVNVTVYPTAAAAETADYAGPWLTAGATVSIQDAENTTVFNGKVGDNGALVTTATGEAASPLTLLDGTYTYTVTPAVADNGTYTTNTGTFQVNQATQSVKLCARDPKDVLPETYQVKLLDGASAGKSKPLAAGTEVSVKVGSAEAKTETVSAGGTIPITAKPGVATALTLTLTGYQPLNITATFSDAGISVAKASRAGAALEMALTMEPPVTKITLPDTVTLPAGSYVVIEKNPDPTAHVNEYMSGDGTIPGALPMTITLDSETNTNITLPNGDYVYTIVSPGNENVSQQLSVRDNQVVVGKTLTNLGSTTAAGIEGGTVSDAGSTTDGVSQVVLPEAGAAITEIEDLLYYGVGEWLDETTLRLTVKVKNMGSVNGGTFGIRYDDEVFTLATVAESAYNSKITLPNQDMSSNDSGTVTAVPNPVADSNVENLTYGYHVFQWQLGDGFDYDAVEPLADGETLVTYTLTLQDGKTMADVGDRSITVMPYQYTANGAVITNAMGGNANVALAYMTRYWWTVNEHNETLTDAHRLAKDKALEDGFYQVYVQNTTSTYALDMSQQMKGTDARTQLTFPHSGKVGVKFIAKVKDKDTQQPTGERLANVKIVVTLGADKTVECVTDANGEVILTLPGNTSYPYTAELVGYQGAEGAVEVASAAVDEPVYLVVDDSHNVVKDPASTTVNLIGAKKAPNGQDYGFTFEPIPGYRWVDGMPKPEQIEVKLLKKENTAGQEDQILSSADNVTVRWDSKLNQYVLPKESFLDTDIKRDIQIGIPKTELDKLVEENDPADNPIKVTTHAEAGGSFSYTAVEVEGKTNTFVPNDGVTSGLHDLEETLGLGMTVSSKYTYTPAWDEVSNLTEEEKAALSKEDLTDGTYKGIYEDRVIDKLIVNGVEVVLTMEQRIYGVKDYQLVGITEDQTVTVTFGNAWIDPKEPGEEDDVIVDPEKPDEPVDPDDPPIDPVPGTKATVSVIVSEYGEAKVTAKEGGETDTVETITGYNRAEYHVVADQDMTIEVKASQTVTAPGAAAGTTTAYIIDRILVNDTEVYACGKTITPEAGITWGEVVEGANNYGVQSGKLTLQKDSKFVAAATDTQKAATTTVTVLFKPAAGEDGKPTDPIFTLLTLKKTAGEGTVTPSNEGMKISGHDASFLFTPATGYQFDWTTVAVFDMPGKSANETVKKTGEKNDTGSTEVTLSNLNGGSLLVTYEFGELEHKVSFTIYYGKLNSADKTKGDIAPQSGAIMRFTRAGEAAIEAEVPTSTGGSATQVFDYDLPAGTWTIELIKSGYVDYVVKGFVITPEGTAGYKDAEGVLHDDTYVETVGDVQVIRFGMTEEEAKDTAAQARALNPKIGDANRDQTLIALDDVNQVVAGFRATSGQTALKELADVDEIGGVDVNDMGYVVGNRGSYRDDSFTYEKFMTTMLLLSAYTNAATE